jgi:hypothetical protein
MWMLRRAATVAGALLVAFHVWLFGGQLVGGELVEPGPLLRWVAAGVLAAALAAVWRRGGSLFRGRTAVAVWVLAALLHGPALAERDVAESLGVPEAATVLANIAAGSAALGLGLLLLGVRRRGAPIGAIAVLLPRASEIPLLRPDTAPRFAPRPPPVASGARRK